MNPHTPKHYVILVHFGLPKPTDRALNALFLGQITPTEVIVVDHAHTPYSTNLPSPITIIRPEQNTGYAAGGNLGLGLLLTRNPAEDDVVIIMNNDVIVGPTTLARATPPAMALVGMCGGRIHRFTGHTELGATRPLDYLDGAFLVSTWQTWGKLSGMPEHYFLYWEDVALSARARQRGISLTVMSELKVDHHSSHLDQQTDDRLYYLVKSGARFLEHETSLLWRLFWWPKNRLRYLYHRWFSRDPKAHLITRALRDAFKS